MVFGPFVGLVAAVTQLWGQQIGWVHILLLVGTYYPVAFGVTGGLHRCFMHRSFVPNRPTKIFLGILALLAIEGPIKEWVTDHTIHHRTADTDQDPHSPHNSENILIGFWHAHVGWIFRRVRPDPAIYAPHLVRDSDIVWLDRLFGPLILVSLLGPYLVAGWEGVLWGGILRMFFVHHVTWSVNSVCHIFGEQPYKTPDKSTNFTIHRWWLKWAQWLLTELSLGEDNHNKHHAFPSSALQGNGVLDDRTYMFIKIMEKLGMVTNIKIPTPQQLLAKRRLA